MAIKFEYYSSGDDLGSGFQAANWRAQTFTTVLGFTITSVKLLVYRLGSPGTVTVSIQGVDGSNKPDGSDVASIIDDPSSYTTDTDGEWIEYMFSTPYRLSFATRYAIVIRTASGDNDNRVFLRADSSSPAYTNGEILTSGDSGSTWTAVSSIDALFETWGNSLVPVDIVAYKRLVAVGNDEVWYENIGTLAGTMIELSAANGDIDTTDQLNIFEAYQKVFVINGANLKVADFVNTKLTLSALTNPPAHGDILTQSQGGSDYAYMVVDFVNTAKTAIYGFAYYGGSATVFDTSNTVSSNNATATMSGSTFIPSAVTAKPHWYDWTIYPDIVLASDATTKSYGSVPDKVYVGCLYRGRPMLSVDPEHSHQWYMSRQGNPWDWAYVANDAGTPVKGGNADMGELGDIVRCLIPYKDDYLIMGCATSIWFMAGDPAAGGSLNELDLTTGIFGANSWCWDGAGNLYFWGTNGFYKTTIPGVPICLSTIVLPDLVNDEAADPSTHRIIMAYDRDDYGINICITKLSDGSNSNYWFDLKTEGFFSETYPDECGPYSLFYYPANDTTLKDLLVGCKDGYIRKFDKTAEDDDVGATNQAIDSYIVLGPIQLSSGMKDGVLSNIDIISAGGESGGSESDSDDIDYSIFAARTSEKVIENVEASPAVSKYSGTFSSPGFQKGNRDRRKIRGRFGAVKIGNNTAIETWGFEKLILDVKQTGRVL